MQSQCQPELGGFILISNNYFSGWIRETSADKTGGCLRKNIFYLQNHRTPDTPFSVHNWDDSYMPCRLEETTFTIKERTSVTDKGTSVTKERTSVTDKGTSMTKERTSVTDKGTSVTKERTSMTDKGTSVTKERTSVTDKGTLLANFDQWMRICWGFEIKWICFRMSAFSISAFPGGFQKMDAIPEMGQNFAENGKIVYRETSPLIFCL